MENPFKKPFAVSESRKEKIIYTLVFGLFIFLFLFIFKPFGLAQLDNKSQFLVSLGFGLVTIKGETVIRKHMRGTLKAAETELRKFSSFFRCHKCFIVNSEYADHVTGNVQNMKIKLKTQGIEIPVSRSKAREANKKFR